MFGLVVRFFKALLFSQANDLIRRGKRSHLQFEDLPALPPFLNPRNTSARFLSLSLRGPWRFLTDVLRATGPRLGGVFALLIAMIVFGVAAPLVMNRLITEMTAAVTSAATRHSYVDALLWSFVFALFIFLLTLSIQHYFYQILSLNQVILNGINKAVYAKSLRLSLSSRRKRPVGDIINHMGSDSHLVAETPIAVAEIVYSIGIISASTVASVYIIGPSALAGLIALTLAIPICVKVANRFVALDEEVLKQKDKRASLMSQLISGIRVVKFLCWEGRAETEVTAVREQELSARWRLLKTWAASDVVFGSARIFAIIFAIGVVVAVDGNVTSAGIFACMALFDLWHHPLSHMSGFIADLAGAKVAAGRLISFLSEPDADVALSEERTVVPVGLCVTGLSVHYEAKELPALDNWSFKVAPGSATAVVGPVGAGKSTFLLTLLGEIRPSAGKIVWNGSDAHPVMAYVPQSPFIMNGCLKSNIEFGFPGNEVSRLASISALDQDISVLPAGFATEIGEQGINLSGGQKQRLNIARACNADAEVVLMDDPFAAVDQRTELHLVDQVLFGELRSRTRIVTTHRLEYLSRFDQVVFVNEGKIKAVGALEDLLRWSEDFKVFYQQHHGVESKPEGGAGETVAAKGFNISAADSLASPAGTGKLVNDEDRASGSIDIRLYWEYVSELAGTTRPGWMLVAMFVSTLFAGFLPIVQNYWLTAWTDGGRAESAASSSPILAMFSEFLGSNKFNLGVFAGLAVLTVSVTWGRQMIWFARSIVAGRSLHRRALNRVMNSKVLFFDRNPVGRILNRFSSDVDAVERTLANSIEQMIAAAVHALLALAVVLILSPWALVAVVPVLFLFKKLQHSYRCTGRETKRLNSISRSPRFAHFKETIEGLESIRAFGREDAFWNQFYSRLELNQRSFHAMILANRWFSARLPILTAMITVTAVSFAVVSVTQGKLSPAQAALLMFLSFNLSDHLNWVVRSFSEAESWMTAFERIRHYGSLQSEAKVVEVPKPLVEVSPMKVVRAGATSSAIRVGSISFENYSARYAADLPHALKGVELDIPAGAKIGIMGRTGSGKSTLVQALYRMIDGDQGRILIDGVDTREIELSVLRQRLAIIPQTPTLFMGTLRQNLDRYDAYSDDEIWRVLAQVQMDALIKVAPAGLLSEIAENGCNFSLGQRQLLCLARAILTDAPVIIMDEATASIDVATDELIQKTIRTAFVDRTMIIIAHRLGTIRHCDQIVEMESGRVVKRSGHLVESSKKLLSI